MYIPNVGRNDPCPCGSGRKFKKCCSAPKKPPPRPVGIAGAYQVCRLQEFPVTKVMGAGRVEALFSLLIPGLPEPVRQRHRDGRLAVYGLNIPWETAGFRPIAEDADVIEFSVNFMRFLYAGVRILSGNANIFRTGGVAESTAAPIDRLTGQFRSLVGKLKSGDALGEVPCPYPSSALAPAQINFAENMALHAELFVIAHEVGHLVVRHQLEPLRFTYDLPTRTQAEEIWVDGFATRSVLRASDRSDLRSALAGAFLALRLLLLMERLGCLPGPDHPPAARRLAEVEAAARAFFADPDEYTTFATIKVAHQQQLNAIESRLLGTPEPEQTAEELYVTLLAVAEEHVRGRLAAEEEFPSIVARMLADAPPAAREGLSTLVQARLERVRAKVSTGQPLEIREPFVEAAVAALLPLLTPDG